MPCPCPPKRRLRKRSANRKRRRSRKPRITARTYLYYAISDGVSREYGHQDRVAGYGVDNQIPDPATVSLTNIFINGVLQPSPLFRISKGTICFLSADVPEKGVPILVQSIRFRERR
ncbi:DUF4183 domain-containing protein [Paenibacillus phyllosphaerae]|uniref:DUF4183 domain-containing protein n=1 Tax=Paenibacillus phyllosphaerae TaxID=274593 RepID=UPI00160EE60F